MRTAPRGYDITALNSEAYLSAIEGNRLPVSGRLVRDGDRNGSRTFFEWSAARRAWDVGF